MELGIGVSPGGIPIEPEGVMIGEGNGTAEPDGIDTDIGEGSGTAESVARPEGALPPLHGQ